MGSENKESINPEDLIVQEGLDKGRREHDFAEAAAQRASEKIKNNLPVFEVSDEVISGRYNDAAHMGELEEIEERAEKLVDPRASQEDKQDVKDAAVDGYLSISREKEYEAKEEADQAAKELAEKIKRGEYPDSAK